MKGSKQAGRRLTGFSAFVLIIVHLCGYYFVNECRTEVGEVAAVSVKGTFIRVFVNLILNWLSEFACVNYGDF